MELTLPSCFEEVTSKQIQSQFGRIADIVKGKNPVAITQYGRPTMVIFPYEEALELARIQATRELSKWLDDRAEKMPESIKHFSLDELNQMIDDERSRL